MLQLRPYQARSADQLREKYRAGHRSVLFVLSTGGGKTVVFCHVAQGAAKRGNVVFIIVHRQELLMQASDKLDQNGVKHGLVAPGHTPTHDKVQVASVQTLARRIKQGRLHIRPDLLIPDEAHHSTAGGWRMVINSYPEAFVLGVTATPIRLDGQGLGVKAGGIFETMVIGPSMKDLIGEGHLVKPVVYAPPVNLDMSGIHSRGGDYVAAEIAELLDKPVITGDAVKHYKRICDGQPGIAFCASVKHAEHVAEEFRAAGYKAAMVDGKMPDLQRKRMIRGLGDGSVQILTSCDLISEGTDLPAVAAGILLRPTQSLGLYLQQTGRTLRPSPGKKFAYIIDHVGNTLLHGFPDDDRDWTLDGIKREPKQKRDDLGEKPTMKQCPKCYAMHAILPACPMCGHSYEPKWKPEANDGTLQELTPEKMEALKRHKRRDIAQAQTLEQLKEIGAKYGHKAGWAKHVWDARQAKRERQG